MGFLLWLITFVNRSGCGAARIAHYNGVVGVVSSNLTIPTKEKGHQNDGLFLFQDALKIYFHKYFEIKKDYR